MKLYAPPLSTAAYKVLAVVHELALPVTLAPLDLMKGEHKSPAFLAKNPNGKVPVLEDDDGAVISLHSIWPGWAEQTRAAVEEAQDALDLTLDP